MVVRRRITAMKEADALRQAQDDAVDGLLRPRALGIGSGPGCKHRPVSGGAGGSQPPAGESEGCPLRNSFLFLFLSLRSSEPGIQQENLMPNELTLVAV